MAEVVNLDEYRKRLRREGATARGEGAARRKAALRNARRKAKPDGEAEAPTRGGRGPGDPGAGD